MGDEFQAQVYAAVATWLQENKITRVFDPDGFSEGWTHTPWRDFVEIVQGAPPEELKPTDGVIWGLLAERTADPRDVMIEREKRLPANAPVIAFFSFGPTEKGARVTSLLRMDIEAMLRPKPAASYFVISRGLVHDEPDGYQAVKFRTDGKELAPMPPGRRLIVGPEQTVSLCMIVKDAEPMLLRVLRSIGPVLNEAVFVDTGSERPERMDTVLGWFSDEFPDIEIKRVKGTHPYFCFDCNEQHAIGEDRPGHNFAGFETPRNEGLEYCTKDWIMWPDSDEEMLNVGALKKFLRPNCYNGYGIRLHHFSAVPPDATKIDMPAKLFRAGQGIKFYGCVTPDTLVTIKQHPNVKPISDIRVGDHVCTHDGSYGRVSKTWRYEIDDDICEISAVGMPESLRITQDHKLLAVRYCPRLFKKKYKPEWIAAKNLCVKDALVHPLNHAAVGYDAVDAALLQLYGRGLLSMSADSKCLYMQVMAVRRIRYRGPVHDITVEGNHSFVFGRVAGANSLHEHPEHGVNKGVMPTVVLNDVDLAHVGYLSENVRRDRFFRNWPLMRADHEKYPERRLGMFLWIRDLAHNARYGLERSGGIITPEVLAFCHEAIERFRAEFASDVSAYSLDVLGYYSDMMRLLKEGAEIEVVMQASKPEVGVQPVKARVAGRFKDADEAAAFVLGHLKTAMGAFSGPYLG